MKLKNIEMDNMLNSLKKLLPMRNKIGYIAARNTRIISEALTEYFRFKQELLEKYGENSIDEKGRKVLSISKDSPNFDDFIKELNVVGSISQNVEIMKLKYDEVIGFLTGEEILNLEWMLEE